LVRDQIRFLPRPGALQTAQQTLVSGEGTAADKASLLIALLRAQGYQAQYLAGELLVDESRLHSLLGVQTSKDLAWALILNLSGYFTADGHDFDPADMIRYVNGKRAWRWPHVWVRALIPVNGSSSPVWVELDPAQGLAEYDGSQVRNVASARKSFAVGADSETVVTYGESPLGTFLFEPRPDGSGGQLPRQGDYVSWLTDRYNVQIQPWSEGLAVSENNLFVPEGAIGAAAPCLQAQEDVLPDGYFHTLWYQISQNGNPVAYGQVPYALARTNALVIRNTGTQAEIRFGTQRAAFNLPTSMATVDITQAMVEPVVYGQAAEARTVPGLSPASIAVLSTAASPISARNFIDDQAKVRALAAQAPQGDAAIDFTAQVLNGFFDNFQDIVGIIHIQDGLEDNERFVSVHV